MQKERKKGGGKKTTFSCMLLCTSNKSHILSRALDQQVAYPWTRGARDQYAIYFEEGEV